MTGPLAVMGLLVAILLLARVYAPRRTVALVTALVGDLAEGDIHLTIVVADASGADLLSLTFAVKADLRLATVNVGLENFHFDVLYDVHVGSVHVDAAWLEVDVGADVDVVAFCFQNDGFGDDLNELLLVPVDGARLVGLGVLLLDLAVNRANFVAFVDLAMGSGYADNFSVAVFTLKGHDVFIKTLENKK